MLTTRREFAALSERVDAQDRTIQQLQSSERSHRMLTLGETTTLRLRPLSAYTDTAIVQGVQRMLDSKWFDNCEFRKLVELARVHVPAELERHLGPLHCVHWNTLDPEYRSQIQQHIVAVFMPVEHEANAQEPAGATDGAEDAAKGDS